MWTVEKITELCVEYCGRCDINFAGPVIINNRLSRTLGRCFYQRHGSVWNPIKIEISRQLLDNATDESIKAVIAHECAHYVTCAATHGNHGHDFMFRFYCEKIGTPNDKTCYDDIEWKKQNKEIYKYTLYCTKCGKFLGGRSRACRVTKDPENFYSNCCKASVKVIKNW